MRIIAKYLQHILDDTFYGAKTNANTYINHQIDFDRKQKVTPLYVIKHFLTKNMHRIYKIHIYITSREEYYYQLL